MTIEDRATLRAVVLQSGVPGRASQLLNDLGHDVSAASSPDDALKLLKDNETDLLVVDVTNSAANRDFVQKLPQLPEANRPRELAIFSDWIDENLKSLRNRINPSHVHVFLKPLHMHGLLGVLRHMNNEDMAEV